MYKKYLVPRLLVLESREMENTYNSRSVIEVLKVYNGLAVIIPMSKINSLSGIICTGKRVVI